MFKILFLIVMILLPISVFSDVTIINKDKVAYKLFIEKENSAEHTAINAKTKAIACLMDCRILIKKSKRSIKAANGDTIIIRDGELLKEVKKENKEKKNEDLKKEGEDKKSGKKLKEEIKVEKVKIETK